MEQKTNPERAEYLEKLSKMSYEELAEETRKMIWLSAYAINNPSSDYHWQVDACYDEWVRRDGNTDNYAKVYNELFRELFGSTR